MRAMVLHEPEPAEHHPLRLEQRPTPTPGAGQVRIEVTACGVCHTDLHLVEGDLELPRLPLVPGHQVVGSIDEVGEGVTTWQGGERVGLPWLHRTCGECFYCLRGRENLCENARFTGWQVDGGFADYVLAPEDFVYALPEGVADEAVAPLLCAGIIGYRALNLSAIQPGERLGLYGFGASAHIAIQIARFWGCQVYVFTRSEEHRQHARELGAAWVGEAQDTPPDPLEGAVIFAPAGWIVPEALRVLRPGGIIALAGIHMSPIPEMPYSLLYAERVLRSVANSTRDDARELLELAARIPLETDVETFPLEEVNEALRRLKHSELRGAAVVTA